MPYVINWPPAKRGRALAAKGATIAMLATAAMGLAASPALADTSSCSAPTVTQPFLSWGDSSSYTLVPGESANSFDGSGWTLTGGANITTTQLVDGSTGQVLDLPSGSQAVSPSFCVNSSYPTARVMIDRVFGPPNLQFQATYDSGGASPATAVRTPHGRWALSPLLNLNPPETSDWQSATFTFTAGDRASDIQLYNFYVDPYAKG